MSFALWGDVSDRWWELGYYGIYYHRHRCHPVELAQGEPFESSTTEQHS